MPTDQSTPQETGPRVGETWADDRDGYAVVLTEVHDDRIVCRRSGMERIHVFDRAEFVRDYSRRKEAPSA